MKRQLDLPNNTWQAAGVTCMTLAGRNVHHVTSSAIVTCMTHSSACHVISYIFTFISTDNKTLVTVTQLGNVMVLFRILLVSLHVVSVDQTLDTFLQISWLHIRTNRQKKSFGTSHHFLKFHLTLYRMDLEELVQKNWNLECDLYMNKATQKYFFGVSI